jgi:hypothetical protein
MEYEIWGMAFSHPMLREKLEPVFAKKLKLLSRCYLSPIKLATRNYLPMLLVLHIGWNKVLILCLQLIPVAGQVDFLGHEAVFKAAGALQ